MYWKGTAHNQLFSYNSDSNVPVVGSLVVIFPVDGTFKVLVCLPPSR